MEEALVYKSKNEEETQVRLQEMGVQAKAAQDNKLAKLKEQPM